MLLTAKGAKDFAKGQIEDVEKQYFALFAQFLAFFAVKISDVFLYT
jgi:hypothetical protein